MFDRNMLWINPCVNIYKTVSNITRLLSGIFILLSFSSCIEYKDVEFLGITDYSINKLDTEDVRITLFLKIKNPNIQHQNQKKCIRPVFEW